MHAAEFSFKIHLLFLSETLVLPHGNIDVNEKYIQIYTWDLIYVAVWKYANLVF